MKQFLRVGILAATVTFSASDAYADVQADYKRGLEAFLAEDLITAMFTLERSAGAGHPDSMVLLAYILDKANEHERAFQLYSQAWAAGSPAGDLGMSDMYANGIGTTKDVAKSRQYLEKAAAANHAPAQLKLADLKLAGELGYAVDRAEAKAWLQRAAAAGSEIAAKKLPSLNDVSASAIPASTGRAPAPMLAPAPAVAKPEPVAATAPPAPVATPTPATQDATAPAASAMPDPDLVLRTVDAWAKAWSDQQPDRYISFYGPQFNPPKSQSRSAWEASRQQKLRKPKSIEITLFDKKVTFKDANRATVEFRQRYRSDTYKDEVNKALDFQRVGTEWRITAERTVN